MGYRNREVEMALNDSLLPLYGLEEQPAFVARIQLEEALEDHTMDALRNSLHALFASILYEWYRRNPLVEFECHYASVFYSQLAALA